MERLLLRVCRFGLMEFIRDLPFEAVLTARARGTLPGLAGPSPSPGSAGGPALQLQADVEVRAGREVQPQPLRPRSPGPGGQLGDRCESEFGIVQRGCSAEHGRCLQHVRGERPQVDDVRFERHQPENQEEARQRHPADSNPAAD